MHETTNTNSNCYSGPGLGNFNHTASAAHVEYANSSNSTASDGPRSSSRISMRTHLRQPQMVVTGQRPLRVRPRLRLRLQPEVAREDVVATVAATVANDECRRRCRARTITRMACSTLLMPRSRRIRPRLSIALVGRRFAFTLWMATTIEI